MFLSQTITETPSKDTQKLTQFQIDQEIKRKYKERN